MNGELALAEYRGVLDLDPDNLEGIDGLGSLLLTMASLRSNRELYLESKTNFQKHTQLKPADAEPHKWIGFIDFSLAFAANRVLRASFKQDEVPPLSPGARGEFSRENGAVIDDGIESSKKAMSLRENYVDAMVILSMLYRCKADTVDSADGRESFIKLADDLVARVQEIMTKRNESTGGQAEIQEEER